MKLSWPEGTVRGLDLNQTGAGPAQEPALLHIDDGRPRDSARRRKHDLCPLRIEAPFHRRLGNVVRLVAARGVGMFDNRADVRPPRTADVVLAQPLTAQGPV